MNSWYSFEDWSPNVDAFRSVFYRKCVFLHRNRKWPDLSGFKIFSPNNELAIFEQVACLSLYLEAEHACSGKDASFSLQDQVSRCSSWVSISNSPALAARLLHAEVGATTCIELKVGSQVGLFTISTSCAPGLNSIWSSQLFQKTPCTILPRHNKMWFFKTETWTRYAMLRSRKKKDFN